MTINKFTYFHMVSSIVYMAEQEVIRYPHVKSPLTAKFDDGTYRLRFHKEAETTLNNCLYRFPIKRILSSLEKLQESGGILL